MVHGKNTTAVVYRVVAGGAALPLQLRPKMAFRHLEAPVSTTVDSYTVRTVGDARYEVRGTQPGLPTLRLWCPGSTLTAGQEHVEQQSYPAEASRGYDSIGALWCPGPLQVQLGTGHECLLVASTEEWGSIAGTASSLIAAEMTRREARLAAATGALESVTERTSTDIPAAQALVLAADAFVISPPAPANRVAISQDEGADRRSVIAGYHWFTAWGRDTMISLEGLALVTGRHHAAGEILRTFARHARRGLIPNFFPEGGDDPLYHTADATLWFIHALHRYVSYTRDRALIRGMLPLLIDIVEWHVSGTDFNIGVDHSDGLLHQGMEGYQLTWMDAKVGDWVVTPRRGKAVEIQGLWYNALRLIETWIRDEDGDAAAREYAVLAETARASFNERFWCAEHGYLYDVIDGPNGLDSRCRPNQLLAFSLEHPILDTGRWRAILDVVTQRLLTPVGLRTLAPGSPDYQPRYDGDVRARDAAYHQGTVWPWLIGPYIDAWTRVHGGAAGARPLLDGLIRQLEAGLGQIGEIFDAEPPHTPRGCIAQAWSVAEVLRCLCGDLSRTVHLAHHIQ